MEFPKFRRKSPLYSKILQFEKLTDGISHGLFRRNVICNELIPDGRLSVVISV